MYGREQIFIFIFITAVFDDEVDPLKLMVGQHRLIHKISVCDNPSRARLRFVDNDLSTVVY